MIRCIGGNQGDDYAFSVDYDFDTIIEKIDADGVIDRIIFGASVQRDALIITRQGDDMQIDLGNGSDVVTVVGGFGNTRIEEYRFADGTTLTFDEIVDQMLQGTDGDDNLIGLDLRDDIIGGGAGSDAMAGGLGDDTYLFNIGDGDDAITDTGGLDRIVFGTAITLDNHHFPQCRR